MATWGAARASGDWMTTVCADMPVRGGETLADDEACVSDDPLTSMTIRSPTSRATTRASGRASIATRTVPSLPYECTRSTSPPKDATSRVRTSESGMTTPGSSSTHRPGVSASIRYEVCLVRSSTTCCSTPSPRKRMSSSCAGVDRSTPVSGTVAAGGEDGAGEAAGADAAGAGGTAGTSEAGTPPLARHCSARCCRSSSCVRRRRGEDDSTAGPSTSDPPSAWPAAVGASATAISIAVTLDTTGGPRRIHHRPLCSPMDLLLSFTSYHGSAQCGK